MTTIPDLPKERTHDILLPRRPGVANMLAPASVALVGATEKAGSVGRSLLENLLDPAFSGEVYPVNPNRDVVLGVPAFSSIKEVPGLVDLAVICTPAATVPRIVGECAEAGVRGAIIISAGFREIGESGKALEKQVLERVHGSGMRIIGPNCLGVMVPALGLNATFAKPIAKAGSVGFISQSGALCAAVLDWSMNHNIGFSAFISIGAMLDVGWGDLIHYLGDDPKTESIIIYMESVGDARAFLSAAREVSLTKPIVVLKVGRTAAASKAAASHTGSLTGSDEVLDAAFRRVGVLRVDTIEELFDSAKVLAQQPRPRGPRLAIVTNAGGPAALATDALIGAGGEIAGISETSRKALDAELPPFWSHNNPVDILGDADAARYAETITTLAKDPENDGVLAILTPQAMTQATETADALAKIRMPKAKPLLASWMGGYQVVQGAELLGRNGISSFAYPDRAARAFAAMWRYSKNLQALYETPFPTLDSVGYEANRGHVDDLIAQVRKTGRTILTEIESKEILSAYAIPTVMTEFAATEDAAARIAARMDGPYVVKLYSETITHKTDVGGVKLNLQTADDVRRAFREIKTSVLKKFPAGDFLGVTVQRMIKREGYEIILGSSIDPQFGPVLLFGTGGQLVEVFKDRSLGLPPLNTTLARLMIEQTKIYPALLGVRGRKGVNLKALEELIVRFSYLVAEQPWIKEIDINPLLVSPDGIVALDARVILHDCETPKDELPRLAIRPYPTRYVMPTKLKDDTAVVIRPIRPEDEPLMIEFHKGLSESTVHQRYCGSLQLEKRIAHDRLTRICFTDYDCEIPLVVDHQCADGSHEIIAVGRLNKIHGARAAIFALVISDGWQHKGLGTHLLKLLVDIGRREGLNEISGTMLPDNAAMRHVCEKAGFEVTFDELANCWRANITL